MAMDLSAPGSHVVAGTGGGTAPGDPFTQNVVDQAAEAALGSPGDPSYDGANTASIVALLKAILGAVSETTVIVTTTGMVPVLPAQSTIVWEPAISGNIDFQLPIAPRVNETHAFKARFSAPGPVMQVSGNGQTIDGVPYWVGINPNDRITVRFVGDGWIIL